MKKGVKVFGLIVILLIIGSAFVGVVSAEEISIDTEIDESSFTVYPSRPAEGWFYVHDHDTFHTRAYDGNFWYTLCGEESHEYPLYYGVWQASLPQSGDYEVFVWILDPDPFVEVWPPHRTYTPTQSAVYQIYHKDGLTTKTVNQELRTGGFYSLGTFNFDTLASVILNDRTGESYLSTMIAFDAVKFVPVAAPNTPPYTPSNPSPANHATGQSIYTDLDWTGGDPDAGDTVTYDVYFGTSTRPLKVSTAQSETTYDPGTLNSNMKYYWRIVATDNHGASTTGPLWDFTTGSTLTCAIELRKDGAEIDEIEVGESFDIYVRDSTDDTGISEVCFSSDDSQDGILTGEWTAWYDWDTSSGDWDAETKIKKLSFDTGGAKEVWADVKDEAGQTSKCSANIYANPLIPQSYAIIVAGEGGHIEKPAIDHSANNAYRVLRNLGFDDDHIFYLNSNRPQDVDGDEDDEIDALASFSNFDNAINEVKDEIEDNPTLFILFLTGHGLPGQFLFDGSVLCDYQLKGMLEEFPSETRMLIFIDSCYSGDFITSINGISASNRIIITGTHNNQKRLWIPWLRSSDRFWGNLNKGLNVKDAFITGAWPGEWWHLWLNDNGDIDRIGSPPNNLGEDGNLAARTQIGVPGTENLKLTPWIFVWKRSPGELRVYDSQNLVTGLVNGEVKEEIPDSIYDEQDEIVALFSPSDTYRYEVAGTDEGTYGLDIASIKGAEATIFTATDIPTTVGAIHQYTTDWDALSQGEKGVTVKMDSDGNGTFERTIITNNSFYPLIAEFTFSPENPLIGEKVTLDASTSFDLGGGEIKKYCWEFYNAANQDPFYAIEGHDKKIIGYSFTSEGIYLVRLTVTDDEGEYSYTESSTKVGSAKSDEDVLLGVPFFSQLDPDWKDQKLGKSKWTIGNSGCALTSAAMVSKYFGWDIDPLRLDAALTDTEIDGISTDGNLDWTKVEEASGGYVDWKDKMMDADWSDIDQELRQDNPCIINVYYKDAKGKKKGPHFVVIRGKVGSKYHFWDPYDQPPGKDRIWPNGVETYTWGNSKGKRIYLYHKGSRPLEKNPISVIDEPPYFYKWSNSGHLDYWLEKKCGGHTYYETYVGGMSEESGSHSKPDCWMEFTPYLQSAGKYWIYVGFCADSSRSTKVNYTVYPNGIDGSSKTVSVNQYSDKECWKEIKLGDTWDLSGSGKTHIVVTDATGEEYDKKKDLSVGTIKFRKAIIADTLNILTPTQTAYRNVGAHDKPIKTSIEVETKTSDNAFAPGLTNKDDYTVKIGDKTADVCTVVEKSDRYVLEIMPPKQAGDGKYDLHVELGSLSDVESNAINYGTKGLDVALIIDSSGSMSWNDPEGYRKTSAKYFVDLANIGDKICVAEFGHSDCNSKLLLPLLEITDESSKDAVKTAIDQVVNGERTPIGGGLEEGYDELSSPRAVAGHNKAGILLTDGNDTCDTEGAARTYAQKFGDNGWVLYTIGLTGDADEDLLQKLAALGNGKYDKAPTNEQLMEIYNALSGRVAGEETMRAARGTAQQGSTSVENALIDSSVTKVKFTISWAGSDLNLTLKKPDGGIIDPDVAEADPNVIYTSASSYEFYTVQSPMPGEWELRIFGADVPAGGEEYTARVMGTANLTMNMYFDRDHYSVGEPIKVSVSLTDALQPITEASVIADIELSPTAASSLKNLAGKDTLQNSLSIAQDQITLFDDGMHGDGMANDGVYANFYTNTNIEGTYKFTAKATGMRSPEEFERVIEQSIYVSVTPTPRATLAPTPTPTPRLTLTPAPGPTLTPTPRPTLRPTATLFEKIEGLTAAIRVGSGI